MDTISFIAGLLAGLFGFLLLRMLLMVVWPWCRMVTTGGKGSLFYVVAMRLRGNPASLIIDAYTSLLHSGAIVTLRDVEAHYVAHRSQIHSAEDLIESVRENPVETHVRIWLDAGDAEWLATHLSDHVDALYNKMPEFEEDGRLYQGAQRIERIAARVQVALHKIDRAKQS